MRKVFLALLAASALYADVPIIQQDVSLSVPAKSWSEMRNERVVRQQFDFSCGAASLATVLKYFYNINVAENEIVATVLKSKGVGDKTKTDYTLKDFALSFADLAGYVQTKGFKGVGVAMDLDALRQLRVPVIIYIKIRSFEHFTVFKGINGDFVYLSDPSFGNMKVKIERFKEMFYQRDDLHYPGRVLAIIPIDKKGTKTNDAFMETPHDSGALYDLLESKMLLQ